MAPIAVSSRSVDHGYQPTSAKQSSAAASSTTSRSSHREQRDRFYGHRGTFFSSHHSYSLYHSLLTFCLSLFLLFTETAEMCEKFILYLFACPLDSTSASAGSQSPDGTAAPRLSEFIAYALYRTRLPEFVTFQALYLLLRLKIRFPAARGSSGHRLFISALMLASKSSCDDTYSNKSWTIVGQGLFSLREINQMERELFGYLGYKVNVEPRDLESFTFELQSATDVSQYDFLVRSVLDASSRRDSLELGTESHVEQPEAVKNSSASIRPSVSSQGATVSTSMPSSVGMAKSASCRPERHAFPAPPPNFIHPFVKNARDRNRPYSMPANSIPLKTGVERVASYSDSPAASVCSSMSYAHSSTSPFSATPSPCASRYTISGRTTPDTPPSDMEVSQWDDTYYYSAHAGLDPKAARADMVSPMSTSIDMKHAVYPPSYAAPPSYAYTNWRA